MKKNVSGQFVGAQLVSATTGAAFTGSVTVYVTGNAGTQAIGSVGSGACTHEGNGFHSYAPAQAETNYDHVAFTFIGTGAVPVTVQIYTSFPQTVDNATNISAIKTKTDSLTFTVAGVVDANALRVGGTTQTGRDIGASVLLSSGTGTGQISLSSGAVLLQATQTGVTIPNVTTVTNLTNAPTAGDFTSTMKTSIGTAVAASAVASVTGNVGGNVTGSVGSVASGGITSGSFASGAITASAIAADAIGASELAADAVTEIATGVWAASTRELSSGANIVLAKGTGVTGFNDLSAAAVNAEVDTALSDVGLTATVTGRIDVASSTLATAAALATVDSVADAIKVTTDKLDDTLELDGADYRFTANALEEAPSGGVAPTASEIADEVETRTIAAVTMVNGLAANTVNASALASDAVTEIQSGLATSSALATVDSVVDAIQAKTDLIPASPAAVGDIPTATQNADALLGRNVSGGSSSGRTVKQAFHFIRNKWVVAGGTLTVYDTDDTTTSWTGAVTGTPGADPVTGMDAS